MHDAPSVAERQAPAQLEQVALHKHTAKHTRAALHVLLEIAVEELEDEVELQVKDLILLEVVRLLGWSVRVRVSDRQRQQRARSERRMQKDAQDMWVL